MTRENELLSNYKRICNKFKALRFYDTDCFGRLGSLAMTGFQLPHPCQLRCHCERVFERGNLKRAKADFLVTHRFGPGPPGGGAYKQL